MPTPIRIKRSAVAGKRPTTDQLQLGELAFNYNDGHLYAKRDTAGVGIGTTTALLTPWKENIGGESIYFENNVGIGSSVPAVKLDVDGSVYIANDLEVVGTLNLSTTTGVSTFSSAVDINGTLDVDGQADLDEVVVAGVATFSNAVDINSTLDVDGDTQLDDLTVAGVATFSSLIDANNRLDVVGGANLDQLNVTGVSTLTGNVSFGTSAFFGDNDKINMGDGNDLQIYHASNGTGIIQNAGSGQLQLRSDTIRLLNQATDEDFAFFRDDGAVELYYNNTKRFETSGIGVTITGETDINGDLNVSGVSTFTGAIEVQSTTTLFGQVNTAELGVSGVATFSAAVDINAGLDVDGQSDLDEVVVAGVSTFTNTTDNSIGNVNTGAVQLDGGMGIAKHLTVGAGLSVAEGLTVAGVSTFVGLTTFTGGNVHISNDLFVGGVEVTGGASIGEDITTRNLNVTGVATVGTGLSLGDDIEAHFGDDGDLRIYHNGVTGNIKNSTGTLILQSGTVRIQDAGSSETAFSATDGVATLYYENSKKLETTGAGVSVSSGAGLTATIAGPANLIIDPTVVGDNTGTVRIKGDLLVDGTQFIANSTTIDLADHRVGIATTVGTNAILDGGGIGIGSANILKTITWNNSSSSLKSSDNWDLASGKTFKINGTDVLSSTTLGSGVVNSSLTNLGTLTALNSLHANVTGVVTAAQADIGTSGLDVDGQTDLDEVVVTGVATFSALVDANARLDVVGGANIDQLNVAGVSTIQTLGVTGDLSVSDKIVHTGDTNTAIRFPSADEFSIETAGTERFRVKPGGNISVAKDLNVTGVTTLGSDVLVGTAITIHAGNIHASTGIITALKFIGDGAGITNLPGISTESTSVFTDVNVSGTSTIAQLRVSGIGTAEKFFVSTGGLEVDGQTDLDELVVAGVSTFNALIDANARIDVVGGANIDQVNAGLSSFTQLDVSTGGLDVDGETQLDELVVAGVSTFSAAVDINSTLDVDGDTQLDDLNVAGVATFSALIDANARLDVVGGANIDQLNVSGVSTLTGNVSFGSSALFGDSDHILLGDGDDLQIYHDATDSYIDNKTGDLILRTSSAGDDVFVRAMDDVFIQPANGANGVTVKGEGAVEIYHNNTKKFETTSSGVSATGDIGATGIITATGMVLVAGSGLDAGAVGVLTALSLDISTGGLDVDGQTDLDEVVVAGVSTFSSDLSIADKIIHTGDTNTAIRFPAADTFTVETAGSERLRVDSNGEILIGLTSARDNLANNASGVEAQVQIEGTSFTSSTLSIIRNSADENDGGIIIGKTRATSTGGNDAVIAGDDLGSLTWAGSDGTSLQFGAEIVAEVQSGVGNDDLPTDLIFKTNGGTTSTIERLRIDSAGLVGIGTDNPDAFNSNADDLVIFGTGHQGLTIRSGTSHDGSIMFNDTNDTNQRGIIRYLHTDDSMAFHTSGGEALRITSTGLVGIGSQSPAQALDIMSANPVIRLTDTDPAGVFSQIDGAGGDLILSADGGAGSSNSFISFRVDGTDANAEKLRITGIGSVGIGTDDPEHALVIKDDGLARIRIRNDSTSANSFSSFNLKTRNGEWSIYSEGSSGASDYLKIFQADVGTHMYFYEDIDKVGINSAFCQVDVNGNTLGNSSFGFHESTADSGFHVVSGGIERFFVGNAGISSFSGTGAVQVPAGNTAARPTGIAGMFRYNSEDGNFEGFTDSWGAIAGSGGGASEVDTNVSSTSAVGVGSFATASFRSAEVIAQIVQIDEYQVGKYLMIHDGTTVTVIEQAAVATGDSMLGSFDGAINGSNAELRVNMVTSGIATVTTKISTVTI